jgi:hypothetical protein
MISIYTLFPDVLNLNGDAANSLVLKKNLEWMGEPTQLNAVSSGPELRALIQLLESGQKDIFVTIGHGSRAGMKSLEAFDKLIRKLIDLMSQTGTPAILVGSALVWADLDMSSKRDRVSEFVVAKADAEGWPGEALGYLNSDLSLDAVALKSNLILTLLHGPFFAKNPSWVERVLELLSVELRSSDSGSRAKGYVEEIWRIEANH